MVQAGYRYIYLLPSAKFSMQAHFGRRQSTLDFQIVRAQVHAALPSTGTAAIFKSFSGTPARSGPSLLSAERATRAPAALLPPLQHSKTSAGYSWNAQQLSKPASPAGPEGSQSAPTVAADDGDDVSELKIDDIMREQSVMLVCQRCQQGFIHNFLDSTSADSICALVEGHDTFGRSI
jgi:hypothetical protein